MFSENKRVWEEIAVISERLKNLETAMSRSATDTQVLQEDFSKLSAKVLELVELTSKENVYPDTPRDMPFYNELQDLRKTVIDLAAHFYHKNMCTRSCLSYVVCQSVGRVFFGWIQGVENFVRWILSFSKSLTPVKQN